MTFATRSEQHNITMLVKDSKHSCQKHQHTHLIDCTCLLCSFNALTQHILLKNTKRCLPKSYAVTHSAYSGTNLLNVNSLLVQADTHWASATHGKRYRCSPAYLSLLTIAVYSERVPHIWQRSRLQQGLVFASDAAVLAAEAQAFVQEKPVLLSDACAAWY